MYWEIKKAKYIKDYLVRIGFQDGKEGIIDFKKYTSYGGVFKSFKDLEYFKKLYVNKDLGTICWPEGQDVAPDTLYSEVTKK